MIDGKLAHIYDVVNPPGRFHNGIPTRNFNPKDLLPLSGRNIPEFAKRRSIREMFQIASSTREQKLRGSGSSNFPIQPSRPKEEYSDADSPEKGVSQTISSASIPLKRSGGGASPSEKKTLKRSKSSASQNALPPSGGQQSLAGFFKPKVHKNSDMAKSLSAEPSVPISVPVLGSGVSEPPITHPKPPSQSHDLIESTCSSISKSPISYLKSHGPIESDPSLVCVSPGTHTDSPSQSQDSLESKVSWSRLFTKPQPPRCQDHDEPCLSMTTRKVGANQGRAFWMCRRPLGPSGGKESRTEWRCNTFIWCSDWK